MNMRDLFPGYYQPTEEEFAELWKECIFSFDTNVLLHIYRYSPKTRERLFDILQKLQERIWIPHQVAYEIHKNRLTVISYQSGAYKEIQTILDKNLSIGTLKEQLFKNYKRHPFIDVNQVIESIERVIKKVVDDLQTTKQAHPNFLKNDELWDKLIDIINGKIGQPNSKDRLKDIYKDSEQRFKDLTPPGYEDANDKKAPDKYGDVVLWRQLIDYAKSERKPIIFVTDDDKEDWWLKHDRKIISPRPELVQEMLTEADVKFYMYSSDRFLDYAQEFLNLSEQPDVIEEAREIRIQDAELQTHIFEEKKPRDLKLSVKRVALRVKLRQIDEDRSYLLKYKQEIEYLKLSGADTTKLEFDNEEALTLLDKEYHIYQNRLAKLEDVREV
ncbi:PIN domain-containing protein [Cylindrospermum stagnale]|nr:PIN domain-containing protein [Cylindrospermum stagnale]